MSLHIIIAIKWEKEKRKETAPWLTAGWQLWLVISVLVVVDVVDEHVSHVGHLHVRQSVFENSVKTVMCEMYGDIALPSFVR